MRVVLQEVFVFLHRRPASRRSHHDPVHPRGQENVDVAPGHAPCGGQVSVVDVQSTATALTHGHSHVASVSSKHPDRSFHCVALHQRHDAPRQQDHGELLLGTGGKYLVAGAEEVSADFRQLGLQRSHAPRQQREEPGFPHQLLNPQSLVSAKEVGSPAQELGMGQSAPEEQQTDQLQTERLPFAPHHLGPRVGHNAAVRDTGRAHCLAGAALHALLPMGHHSVINFQPPFIDGLHQRDTAPG